MRLRVSKIVSALAVIAAVGLANAPRADAALILAAHVENGVIADICAADNNIPCTWGIQVPDINPAVGVLQLAPVTLVGTLVVQGSIHTSSAVSGANLITSSSLNVTNTGASTVSAQVAVGDTDFIPPAGLATSSGSGTWTTAQGSTITMQWYNDPFNRQGAETPTDRPGDLVFSASDTAAGPVDAFSFNSGPVAVNDPLPFSMTLAFDFDLVSGGSLLNRGMAEFKTFGVPEPGSTMAFLGLGLLGVGMLRRKMMI